MAVASLSRVKMRSPRGELGRFLAKLMEFGQFHPDRREGMTQDIAILLLGSKAQSIYSEAGDLLEKGLRKLANEVPKVEKFEANGVDGLLKLLEDYIGTIREFLPDFVTDEEVGGIRNLLKAIRESALLVFNNLEKIFTLPDEPGFVTTVGFVPTASVKAFNKLAHEYIIAIEPVKKRGREDPYVPSLLVNPRFISTFQTLTLGRGIPKYSEIDPTPILAFVFPFFFGIMFGDLGHGVLIVAAGVYLRYRTKYTYWGQLLIILGASAATVGFVRGEFFGVPFVTPLGVLHLPRALSGEFTLDYVPLLLEAAIVIGTFHLASAYAIGFINQLRSGNLYDAFMSRLPTLVLYASIVPFGLAVAGTGLNLGTLFVSKASTPFFEEFLGLNVPVSLTASLSAPVIVATLVVLVISHPLKEYTSSHDLRKTASSIGSGLLEAVIKPFEFFLNTLSYVRLGVLLITTSILASLVAGALNLGIFGIIFALLLNIMIVAMEGLIVYIQDMRLQLYEWFSQFYSGTGKPFSPLIREGSYFHVNWIWGPPSVVHAIQSPLRN
jgi:V/A-type H+/Na+-transporting ATPase subunit I